MRRPALPLTLWLTEMACQTWSIRSTSVNSRTPLGRHSGSFLEGRYFDDDDELVKVDDPVCATVTSLQGLMAVLDRGAMAGQEGPGSQS